MAEGMHQSAPGILQIHALGVFLAAVLLMRQNCPNTCGNDDIAKQGSVQ